MTTAQDIPQPSGAIRVHDWDQPDITGYPTASRYFVGTSRMVDIEQHDEDITVTIDGVQYADRRINRYVTVGKTHPDEPLTPQQARELAVALAAAADEAEQMSRSRRNRHVRSGYDKVVVR